MAAIEVTTTKITKFATPATTTVAAATSTTVNEKEDFEIEYSTADSRVIIVADVANTHGTVKLNAPKGAFWAGGALSVNCVQNKRSVFVLEGGKHKAADGTITLEAEPATGKRLLTDHALKIEVIELL